MSRGSRSSQSFRRQTKAIHLAYTTHMSNEEIAEELGVTPDTVSRYINDTPEAEQVSEMMRREREQVRILAIQELKRQLMDAGERSRSAEKPVKIWQQDGQVQTRDVRDDSGQLVDMEPVPVDVEILPDEEARYVSRKEVRDILKQLAKLTGANEPQQHEVSIVDEWRDSANE